MTKILQDDDLRDGSFMNVAIDAVEKNSLSRSRSWSDGISTATPCIVPRTRRSGFYDRWPFGRKATCGLSGIRDI